MLMSVIHSLFRVVSEKEESPSRILTVLNTQACRDNDTNMFVTFFVGCLDLYTGKFRYSNAGHDKPFLLSGNVSVLPSKANLPLGVFPDTVYEEEFIELTPGSSIFLYTDGLPEAENINHDQFEMNRTIDLAHNLQQNRVFSPTAIIERMTSAVHEFVGEADQSDDLTMLAIQYTKHHEEIKYQRTLTLTNDLKRVPRLNTFIDEVCEANGFDMSSTMQINLAIEEAVVNVMNYAYPAGTVGNVTIEVKSNGSEVSFIIIDSGTPFDPTAKPEVDITLSAEDRSIGGLGIHLIRQIMDHINYERVNGRNVLTLIKKISK